MVIPFFGITIAVSAASSACPLTLLSDSVPPPRCKCTHRKNRCHHARRKRCTDEPCTKFFHGSIPLYFVIFFCRTADLQLKYSISAIKRNVQPAPDIGKIFSCFSAECQKNTGCAAVQACKTGAFGGGGIFEGTLCRVTFPSVQTRCRWCPGRSSRRWWCRCRSHSTRQSCRISSDRLSRRPCSRASAGRRR